jgi:hypothetical protein
MINLVKGQSNYSGLYIKPQETRIGNRARTEPTCDHVWPLLAKQNHIKDICNQVNHLAAIPQEIQRRKEDLIRM